MLFSKHESTHALCLLFPALILFLSILARPSTSFAQIHLNEVIAANATGIQDEDGDRSDWIEFHNPGPEVVDLAGFTISDNIDEPAKWTFQTFLIRPGSYALLYASGKDRHPFVPGHWETILDWGDTMTYRAENSEPPSDWRSPEFDDASWLRGPTGIGRGDGDDATVIPNCYSFQARFSFELPTPAEVSAVMLHVDYDDGFVAFLNGVEIARANLGTPGTIPPYNQLADETVDALLYRNMAVTPIPIENFAPLLRQGTNTLAIQVHNTSYGSDLSLIPFLTLGLDYRPAAPRGIPEVIRHDFMLPHCNFKLDQNGEPLLLSRPDGTVEDQMDTGQLIGDVSKGRQPDGTGDWYLFTEPTPGTPNVCSPCTTYIAATHFSHSGGFQTGPVSVEITCPTPGVEIHYSTNCDAPTLQSPLYADQVLITETCILRARAFLPGSVPSPITTHSYLFEDDISLATISLVTDPLNLWDPDIGLLAIGDGDPEYPYLGANFWKEWERPAHLEMFEPDGSTAFNLDAGMAIFGGASRALPQKSFRIITRNSYGESPITYPIFPQLDITTFKQLLLRNSGQDNCRSHFRDGMMHELAMDQDIDLEAYRPAVVFLNGEYWGILNIRERQNGDYLASHHGVDPDEVDLARYRFNVLAGCVDEFRELGEFIESHPMSQPANYNYVGERFDLASFREYNAANIFYGNTDWPGANTKYWRPWTEGGLWRYLAFDMDPGLGSSGTPADSDLQRVLNIYTGTYPFAYLCENSDFRRDFVNTMTEFLSTCFRQSVLHDKLDEIVAVLEPEIERHMLRWGNDLGDWNEELAEIGEFIDERREHQIQHLRNSFGLADTLRLSLDVSPTGSGRIQLTTQIVDPPWSGLYFVDNRIPLTALPNPGYAFARWSDPTLPHETGILLAASGDLTLTACFTHTTPVVINEINYNAADDFDPGDWVEFVNTSDATLNLGGCHFRDEVDSHDFIFPSPCFIEPGGFLVLCENSALFSTFFPDVEHLAADMGFGFSGGGELLRLYGLELQLIDQVQYDDSHPWPPEADGDGPTLELIDRHSDNALPQNWGASTGHGTPGHSNSVAVAIDDDTPLIFAMSAPFPNPFNPSTVLRFSLPAVLEVELSFFDVRGRLVDHLPLGRLEAGSHEILWQPDDLASGLYFSRLRAGAHSETRRLMLLK
ncbi:MAG: hypothetical protein GY835_07445 [bacterium]|nr:hypothetical protein [bacterium]